jgi:hypothetical protein
MSLMGAFYRSRPSRKGRSSGNPQLNALESTVLGAVFSKSVPKSISRNGLNDTGKRESLAGRFWRRNYA